MDSACYDLSTVAQDRAGQGRPYLEFLRVASMSAGLYELPAGGTDVQEPHATDEIYYVLEGVATFTVGEASRPVGAGSILYVRAGIEHRFDRIEQRLRVLVVFAPAESRPA